jgi:hypothetical protein
VATLNKGGKDAERHEQATATKISNEIQRRRWRPIPFTDVEKGAGESDEVDVVSSGLRKRSILTPSRHSPEHQPAVPAQALVRSQS